jgi:hypothetical protein
VCNSIVPPAVSTILSRSFISLPEVQPFTHTFNMHNTLAVLFSSLIFFSASTAALFLPQFRLSPSKSTNPELANKCSFTLWHKQLCTAATKNNYIQLNEIQDHTNQLTIDIAALRPMTARNSYSKISAKQVFAVEGLLHNTNLTIRGEDGSDEVWFEHDGTGFSSDVMNKAEDAWCVTESWDVEDWQCGAGTRVS